LEKLEEKIAGAQSASKERTIALYDHAGCEGIALSEEE